MSNTTASINRVVALSSRMRDGGHRPTRAFRRHCETMRPSYEQRCQDLAEIREEALASKPKTWADA